MKPKLYRCKFKKGKLPQNWMDKEYNVIDEKDGEVKIGKTWIEKNRIEIIETDFGKPKKFLRKISSLTPEDGILIETEEERQAIAPFMPDWVTGAVFLSVEPPKPCILNIDFCNHLKWFIVSEFSEYKSGTIYKVSDFVEVKPKQDKPQSNLAKIAKWIEANPSTTSHELFVHLVANGLVG